MTLLTTRDVLLVGAAGGLAMLLGLAAFVGIGLALHAACTRAVTAWDTWRTGREDLKTCRAIDARGTTTEPDREP
ncbi:hypothetical protein [Streptomyces blattellae]|uniref:hypothetical protein n=1 Tax=Streptomyces blattellae TaxID=2569855 RepID=UPI0012BA0B1F|nr:hypothetical protein [Streptomyces blattellae]